MNGARSGHKPIDPLLRRARIDMAYGKSKTDVWKAKVEYAHYLGKPLKDIGKEYRSAIAKSIKDSISISKIIQHEADLRFLRAHGHKI